jgi:hypothetical protein
MPNTIMLKGRYILKEAEAAAAITPGHLVEVTSAGLVQVQSGANEKCQLAFAFENDLIGRGIDDAYSVSETVRYGVVERGAEVYAWLDGGENVAIGAFLAPAGDGSLVETTGGDASACAIALAAVDNSATTAGGAHKRIQVEAL